MASDSFIQWTYTFDLIEFDPDRILKLIVFEAKGQAQELHRDSPRGGIQYGKHKASAPGEPPAVDTGDLLASIYAKGPTGLTAEMGAAESYAGYLEEGTRFMAARPWLNKAAVGALDTIIGNGEGPTPFNVTRREIKGP